ncbi:MAG: A24 family peptidase [Rhodospirillales bacterium]|nr:A24 family peptidase [Rhodospirillales bacterium]
MAELLRPDALLLIFAAPCVGSFLGVVIERLPTERPILRSRSACDHCGTRLGARDLVPLASWALARGRCRHCGGRLSLFYPAIELAALAMALWSLAVLPGWLAWAGSALGWTLLALAVIDARHMILPNELSLPLIPAGLAVAWALDPGKLPDHALGALAGFLLILALAALYRRLRKREGIGLGDAKLLAAAGAWVSWQGLASVLLLGAASGLAGALVIGFAGGGLKSTRAVPFGPYLAAGFWLVWLYGPLGLG